MLPPEAIAARVDGELRDLSFVPTSDATVGADRRRTTTVSTCCGTRPLTCWRRPCAGLHPGAKYAIGPSIEDGFYYDIELPEPSRPTTSRRSRPEMREIVAADEPFIREEVSRADALRRLADQPYKREIIEGLGEDVGGGRGRPAARLRHVVPQRRLDGPVPGTARALDAGGWARSG